jgi:hypothetical protein
VPLDTTYPEEMDAVVPGPDPHPVPTLRDLIQNHTDRTGESRRALGDRSGIAHQTLGTWYAGTIQEFPEPDRIRKFAHATGYSEQTVLLAAAATVGLRVSQAGTPLINSLPPGTDSLAPEDVDAIRAVVRQMVDARNSSTHIPTPDLSRVEGLRLSEYDTPQETKNPSGRK